MDENELEHDTLDTVENLDELEESPEVLEEEFLDYPDEQTEPMLHNKFQNQKRSHFGEKEYNAARDDNGKYNKNYYADRKKELDKNLDEAEKEKNTNFKKKDATDNGPVKADGSNTLNKTWQDKARDRVNLTKAKNDRLQNKISSAKSKAYQVMHPGEVLKDKAKSAIKDTGKKTVTAAENSLKKVVASGGKKITTFLLANPYILIILIAIVLLFFIILMFFGGSKSGNNHVGLFGYDYYPDACTEVQIEGNRISIDDYVAGVVAAEVGSFGPETQKVFAIAARTYIVQNGKKIENKDGSCYYDATGVQQAYNATPTETHFAAANETRGLIITLDSVPKTYYDASCVYTASEALAIDPAGNYSSDNYYIRYGSKTIGGINFQPVEIEKASAVGTLSYYAKESIANGPCSHNHGMGMSQNGSGYLEEFNSYTWKDIISYYYKNQEEIKSIYASYAVTNNWTQVISTADNSSIETTILNIPLKDLLSKNEYDELNDLIYDSVVGSGVGTRDAIISAAVIPIKYLAENYNVVIPYTLGGGHTMGIYRNSDSVNIQKTTSTYYGLDPDWGTPISHSYGGGYYDKYGPDCSSWVPWVYHNAGISMYPRTAKEYVDVGVKHAMGGSYTARPGDLLGNSEHITVVVGVSEEENVYYIAHASGGKIGTIISTVAMDSSKYYILEMTDYIESHRIENYETEFANGVLDY